MEDKIKLIMFWIASLIFIISSSLYIGNWVQTRSSYVLSLMLPYQTLLAFVSAASAILAVVIYSLDTHQKIKLRTFLNIIVPLFACVMVYLIAPYFRS